VKNIAKHNHLPDYELTFDEDTDAVIFKNREQWWKDRKPSKRKPFVRPETLIEIQAMIPRGEDVYDWQAEWVNYWIDTECPPLQDPDAALLGFCKNKLGQRKQRDIF